MKETNRKHQIFFTIIVIGIFEFLTFGRMWEDSLRFDEAMEYWISNASIKYMYELINTTLQPPVYNFISHFWLMLSHTEVWFRILNVVCHTLGTVGLVFLGQQIKKGFSSVIIAVVVQYSFSAMCYYNQICGEYVLVLPLLYWTCFFAVKAINDCSWKNYIMWIICAVLAIGTQYGAMFIIVGSGFTLLLFSIVRKDWNSLKKLFLVGIVSICTCVIPIYYFFARHQMNNQGSEILMDIGIKQLIKGAIEAFLFSVYSWHDNYSYVLKYVLIVVVILIIFAIGGVVYKLIRGKSVSNKSSIIAIWIISIVAFVTYCIGVGIGFYAYGNYSSRHTVLIIPACVIMVSSSLIIICENISNKIIKNGYMLLLVLCALPFIINTSHYVWIEHWDYDQIDTACKLAKQCDENTQVWVNFMAAPSALYYLNGTEKDFIDLIDFRFSEKCVKVNNVTFSVSNKLINDYNQQLPEKCLMIVSDGFDAYDNCKNYFLKNGYNEEIVQKPIASKMASGTMVIYFRK